MPPRSFASQLAGKLACQSLAGFVREAWHVLEPNTTYVHNWHIDAICQHLEAVTEGRITRLLNHGPAWVNEIFVGLGALAGLGMGTMWQVLAALSRHRFQRRSGQAPYPQGS